MIFNRLIILSSLALIYQATFALNPVREYPTTPKDFGAQYEEIQIRSTDGMMLAGWFLKGPADSYKLVILSDDGDGNMADLLELGGNFVSLGYNVILYDYRGYGGSSDFEINPKFLIYAQFAQDLEAVLDYARKYHSKLRTIHLYGKGIGAALSIGVGCNRSDDVNKIIADCPYSNFEEIRQAIQETESREVIVPIVYNKYVLEPFYTLEKRYPKIKGILFISGANDPVYHGKMMKSLAKRSDNSTVYIAKEATYSSTFSVDRDAYFQQIKSFVKD